MRTRFTATVFALLSFVSFPVSAQEVLELRPVQSEPGKPSLLKLRLQLTSPLPSDARFTLVFPGTFDLDGALLAGSNDLKGGLRLTRNGDSLAVARSGLGPELPAGREVTLFFGPVRPPATVLSDSIRIILDAPLTRETQFNRAVQYTQ